MSNIRPLVVLLVATALLAGACGSGGGGDEPSDAEALVDLRAEVELAGADAPRLESLLNDVFAIATRNAGEPLGDEAFAFAEEVALANRWLDEGPYSALAPAPPAELDETDAHALRNLAGFILAVPAPYEATATLAKLREEFLQTANLDLNELEWAATSRTEWAGELLNQGETEGGWWSLVALLDGGMSASMGSKNAEEYAADQVQLAYHRELAVAVGEPAEFLAAWDQLIAATALATYEPPQLRVDYRDGKVVTIYTEEAATGGVANASQLTEAVAALRLFFPAPEQ